jgi:hypothetical protein
MISKSVYGLSAEGGHIEVIYQGSVIKFLSLTLYGETGQSKEEYVFANDSVWISKSLLRYDRPLFVRDENDNYMDGNLGVSEYKIDNYVIHNGTLYANVYNSMNDNTILEVMADEERENAINRVDYLLTLIE